MDIEASIIEQLEDACSRQSASLMRWIEYCGSFPTVRSEVFEETQRKLGRLFDPICSIVQRVAKEDRAIVQITEVPAAQHLELIFNKTLAIVEPQTDRNLYKLYRALCKWIDNNFHEGEVVVVSSESTRTRFHLSPETGFSLPIDLTLTSEGSFRKTDRFPKAQSRFHHFEPSVRVSVKVVTNRRSESLPSANSLMSEIFSLELGASEQANVFEDSRRTLESRLFTLDQISQVNLPRIRSGQNEANLPLLGLAISGGGIRSSVFHLGALRKFLFRAEKLGDMISVSGGSAFVSRFLKRTQIEIDDIAGSSGSLVLGKELSRVIGIQNSDYSPQLLGSSTTSIEETCVDFKIGSEVYPLRCPTAMQFRRDGQLWIASVSGLFADIFRGVSRDRETAKQKLLRAIHREYQRLHLLHRMQHSEESFRIWQQLSDIVDVDRYEQTRTIVLHVCGEVLSVTDEQVTFQWIGGDIIYLPVELLNAKWLELQVGDCFEAVLFRQSDSRNYQRAIFVRSVESQNPGSPDEMKNWIQNLPSADLPTRLP